jgi:hypothetical protein
VAHGEFADIKAVIITSPEHKTAIATWQQAFDVLVHIQLRPPCPRAGLLERPESWLAAFDAAFTELDK